MESTNRYGRRYRVAAAILLFGAMAMGACESAVETDPLGQLTTDNFFETPDHAIQATNATYNMLRNWEVHVFSWIGLTDIISDDATKGSTPGDAGFLGELDNFTFTTGNGAFSGIWGGYYRGIFRAIVAIDGIPRIDMDETLKNRLIAENKFLRAYYYFFLVRGFGGVPLITKPLDPSEYEQQRATAEEVYAQIEQDLTEAIPALPLRSQYGASDQGRATRGAAQALLAKVHLQQEEFDDALTQAEAVINSGEYSLFPTYNTLFTDAGENTGESVFEIQAVALEQGGGGSQYAQVQGVRGNPNVGWGFNQPSDNLVQAFEPGDPRLEATVLFPWELTPDGQHVVYWNTQMTNQQYNQKVYVSPDVAGGPGDSGVNIRRIRYADVLLIAAEAAARTGAEGKAQTWLNMVRARARSGATATLGISAEPLDARVAAVLGPLVGPSRVFIRYADPEGPGFAAGLRSLDSEFFDYEDDDLVPILVNSMDVVQAVGATPITTIDSYNNAIRQLAPGQLVTVTVVRLTQQEGAGTAVTTAVPIVAAVTTEALLPDVTVGGQALLEAIWHERRVELAMEQHRWFDLIRTGQAAEAIGAPFIEGMHELFPIPQREVDIAGLQQNPNYN